MFVPDKRCAVDALRKAIKATGTIRLLPDVWYMTNRKPRYFKISKLSILYLP